MKNKMRVNTELIAGIKTKWLKEQPVVVQQVLTKYV